MNPGLRLGTAADLELVTDILVEAFRDDPLIHYTFDGLADPDTAHRAFATASIRDIWIPYS